MKQIIKYKSREEWLQNRSNGIGASEAGTVLGLNPWETPYQLWRRKKGIDHQRLRTSQWLQDTCWRMPWRSSSSERATATSSSID